MNAAAVVGLVVVLLIFEMCILSICKASKDEEEDNEGV